MTSTSSESRQRTIIKIIIQFIFFELLFLFLLNLGFVFLPHQELDIIYFTHINLYFLIACFSFLNFQKSKLNRLIILLFFVSSSYIVASSLFSVFAWSDHDIIMESNNKYYLFYNLVDIFLNTLYLFISIYLFVYIKKPFKKSWFHLLISIIFSLAISGLICFSFFQSGQIYQYSTEYLYGIRNKMYLINFSILLLFWNEYSKQKHNLSEYLANIIVIYTIIVGLEIVHIYLIKNDIVIYNLGQYFTGILNLLMLIVWIFRLNYLHSPQSVKNEHYIKNYKILHGFIEKPRTGLFERYYHSINPRVFWTILLTISIFGATVFLFNHFNLFVKRNILLLIISLIISIIVAIMYWNKRWYRAIEFLIKKKKH